MNILEKRLRNYLYIVQGRMLAQYLRYHRCKIGSRLKVKKMPIFRQVPNANIEIGDDVNIGFRITFDISPKGRVALGDHVNLTQDIIISSYACVEIGAFTQVAEFVSVRDSDHGTKRHQYIALQAHESRPIRIGEDVWLGAGVRVLKGSNVTNGVVIGANSVVLAHSTLRPFGIYAGTPLRLIRYRIG